MAPPDVPPSYSKQIAIIREDDARPVGGQPVQGIPTTRLLCPVRGSQGGQMFRGDDVGEGDAYIVSMEPSQSARVQAGDMTCCHDVAEGDACSNPTDLAQSARRGSNVTLAQSGDGMCARSVYAEKGSMVELLRSYLRGDGWNPKMDEVRGGLLEIWEETGFPYKVRNSS